MKLLAAPAGGVVCLGPDVKKAEIRGCCLCGWLCFVVLSLPRVKVPAAPQTADDEGAINQQYRSGAVGRTKLRSEVLGAYDDCGGTRTRCVVQQQRHADVVAIARRGVPEP